MQSAKVELIRIFTELENGNMAEATQLNELKGGFASGGLDPFLQKRF